MDVLRMVQQMKYFLIRLFVIRALFVVVIISLIIIMHLTKMYFLALVKWSTREFIQHAVF